MDKILKKKKSKLISINKFLIENNLKRISSNSASNNSHHGGEIGNFTWAILAANHITAQAIVAGW